MTIRTLGVIGAGTMGNGIAQAAAQAGLDVVMQDIMPEAVERGLAAIGTSLDRLIRKEKLDEAGKAAARLCALNVLAQLEAAVGDLDRAVVQCVRLGGFINAAPGFSAVAGVMNGASDLMVELLGDRGRHARSTVGVAELPLDAAVEVEAMFEVR